MDLDRLVDLEELVYYNQIQPIKSDGGVLIFNSKEIEEITNKIYNEISLAKALLKKNIQLMLMNFHF
ncbi:hypothetical protein [Desulfitibacter alkalitolerans]|uniref:hypothetical protein n=1 Tax=Desulfitibacter alkalitolerans TaxID=264641 RepID=UPI0004820777|nr:hypothetical protein [Desulfitibacter alkalitolerans]